MIYLSQQELAKYYGTPAGGLGKGKFSATERSNHQTTYFKYEFHYYLGFCVGAIIQKKSGGDLSVIEAQGYRNICGKSAWLLLTAFNPDKDGAELQKFITDDANDLHYEYSPSPDDRFQTKLLCSHQRNRQQVVIWHPKWLPSLEQISRSPI
jgi:hypothetical protein